MCACNLKAAVVALLLLNALKLTWTQRASLHQQQRDHINTQDLFSTSQETFKGLKAATVMFPFFRHYL